MRRPVRVSHQVPLLKKSQITISLPEASIENTATIGEAESMIDKVLAGLTCLLMSLLYYRVKLLSDVHYRGVPEKCQMQDKKAHRNKATPIHYLKKS